VESVPADGSFFALGGDSIMSMLLVSKARRAGVAITARQVFEQQTPAGLALVAEEAGGPVEGEPGVGEVPLTPVMRELLDRTGVDEVGELALSTLLVAPAGLDGGLLVEAVRAVVGHHDLLRARLVSAADGGWSLSVPEAGEVVDLVAGWVRRVDVAGLSAEEFGRVGEAEIRAAAGRIDPRGGVMVQVVWFDAGPQVPGRVLLLIAHLVVDTVSLRILVPDLAEAYTGLAAGQEPVLQSVPTSFRHWARAMDAQARGEQRLAELSQWTALIDGPDPLLSERPLDPEIDLARTRREVSVQLPVALWSAVLR
jgi:hypothetical protein